MGKEVVISNSSLNSYGFRVLTEGIDTRQFERNPLLLWMHIRPLRGTTDEVLPLGRVENLRRDGDCLIGTPVFDETDPFAQRIKSKWDAGILKMVSAGLDVIEQSDAPEVLTEGQRFATVTRSRLREVSIVDLGANDDALVLNYRGQTINLADGNNEPTFLKKIFNNPSNTNEMKQISLALGLSEEATEQEVLDNIEHLKTLAAETERLTQEVADQKAAAIRLAVDNAVAAHKILADSKDHFVRLGEAAGIEALNETLAMMPSMRRPMDLIDHADQPADGYKTLRDIPTERLQQFYDEHHDDYVRLYRAEYGVNPEK